MTNNDKEEFAVLMGGLAENFGDTISASGMKLRFNALFDFDIQQVKQAAMSILRTRKYTKMPTVADFIEHINGGSAEDLAQIEAVKVFNAVREVGNYHNVVFDDPVTQAVIQQGFGGWQKLCGELMDDQQQWFIKDFSKTYSAYSRRGIKHYGELPGAIGSITKFVGDEKKCLTIAEGTNETKQIGILNKLNLLE